MPGFIFGVDPTPGGAFGGASTLVITAPPNESDSPIKSICFMEVNDSASFFLIQFKESVNS